MPHYSSTFILWFSNVHTHTHTPLHYTFTNQEINSTKIRDVVFTWKRRKIERTNIAIQLIFTFIVSSRSPSDRKNLVRFTDVRTDCIQAYTDPHHVFSQAPTSLGSPTMMNVGVCFRYGLNKHSDSEFNQFSLLLTYICSYSREYVLSR